MDMNVLNSLSVGHTNCKQGTLFLKPTTTPYRKDRVHTCKCSKLKQNLRSVSLSNYYEE